MAETEPSNRYRLGPRSTRGLIAGWSTGQVLCVAGGLVFGLMVMRSVGGGLGLVMATFATSFGLAAALWPISGRTAEQWAPTVLGFGIGRAAEGAYRPWERRRPKGPLSHLSLVSLDEVGRSPTSQELPQEMAGSPGVVVDSEAGTSTVVLPVGGAGFALMDGPERERRIADWSGVMAALARDGGGLHRLQWVFSSYPSWIDGPLAAGGSGAPAGDYQRLLEEASPSLWEHETLLALTVKRRIGPQQRQDLGSALHSQLASVSERLTGVGLCPGLPLSTLALASRLKRSFKWEALDGMPSWPWPVGVANEWSRLHTDESWHVSYWIAEWPRTEVQGGWLLPLLFASGVRATVSMTLAPMPPLTAVRRAERERTEGTADAELRRRHGFTITARASREQEGRHQREAELADGHAAYRFSGYVTVTETDPASLDLACGRIEQAAALAQLELRRLYGSQEDGFCATLPVGRGCR